MILEGLVTTTDASGKPHLAPMGPRLLAEGRELLLRPFPTSQTFRNLRRHGEGVFHITDDARLIAFSAVGRLAAMPAVRPASQIAGFALTEACQAWEFRVRSIDDQAERVQIHAEIVTRHVQREFLGFNRAKHAVLEAAILATRLHLLPRAEVEAEYRKLRTIVDKTAGPDELEAMAFLESYLSEAR